jgi:ABC-type sugar transport system ATPase subunit
MKSFKIDMLPEDRKDFGFVPLFSVRENLSLSCLKRISSFGIINKKKEKILANQSIDALSIKTAGQDTPVYTLSGGNQQKVVLGKCLNILPKLLILDEPTRGIDIQAKEQIYDLLRKLCNEQKISMIFISSELEEVLLISDRILIMREGELKGEVDPASVDIEKLTEMVIGEEKHEQQ